MDHDDTTQRRCRNRVRGAAVAALFAAVVADPTPLLPPSTPRRRAAAAFPSSSRKQQRQPTPASTHAADARRPQQNDQLRSPMWTPSARRITRRRRGVKQPTTTPAWLRPPRRTANPTPNTRRHPPPQRCTWLRVCKGQSLLVVLTTVACCVTRCRCSSCTELCPAGCIRTATSVWKRCAMLVAHRVQTPWFLWFLFVKTCEREDAAVRKQHRFVEEHNLFAL